MFLITIAESDIPQLNVGLPVRINGRSEVLRRVDDTLQWGDAECRCVRQIAQIAPYIVDGVESLQFICV